MRWNESWSCFNGFDDDDGGGGGGDDGDVECVFCFVSVMVAVEDRWTI